MGIFFRINVLGTSNPITPLSYLASFAAVIVILSIAGVGLAVSSVQRVKVRKYVMS